MAGKGHRLSRADLDHVVATNNKRRFAFSADGNRIRAVQGHSRTVALDLAPQVPPELLFHGTVERFIASIRAKGLVRGNRQYVHLSPDRETADIVGRRRGDPVILTIDAAAMASADRRFYLSENGVWLTDHVPTGFIVGWD
jgi:putative RNA 2'-phosphotransferase